MSTGNQVDLSHLVGWNVDVFISRAGGGGGYLKHRCISAGRNGILVANNGIEVFIPIHSIRSIEAHQPSDET